MTEICKLNDIRYEINDTVIFEKINASVHAGDIIGIIGKNGAGKSTLLQLMKQEINPTDGHIQWVQSNLVISMVEQEVETHHERIESIAETKLLNQWNIPKHEYAKLSGGEKVKLRLVEGFSSNADLLLLDEPTNHLDQEGLGQLCKQIKNMNRTIILVSHDRYFLDLVATKIWSIEDHSLYEHQGNYSSYMEIRKHRRLSQQREFEKQKMMVDRIEKQMKQLTSWSEKAHSQSTKQDGFKEYYRAKAKRMDVQMKSKQKRLEKELEKANLKPLNPEYSVKFSIKAQGKNGKRLLEVRNLFKAFENNLLFQDVRFTIQHGEKIALYGPNGSGKTTFLNILLGKEKADSGEVWISPSAEIGYLSQEVFDLPLEVTPAQLFSRETFKERGTVQTLMKHLGFTAAQWGQQIGQMSMGERVKCKLMKYMLEEKDVLILDEPTNHLDLPSREQLEETLQQYDGTLIMVSHDRYFLEKTTSSKLVFLDKKIIKQFAVVPAAQSNNAVERRLVLETERQEVLGKLSLLHSSHKDYQKLDERFMELTREIKELDG